MGRARRFLNWPRPLGSLVPVSARLAQRSDASDILLLIFFHRRLAGATELTFLYRLRLNLRRPRALRGSAMSGPVPSSSTRERERTGLFSSHRLARASRATRVRHSDSAYLLLIFS